jgi:hypothetical protein
MQDRHYSRRNAIRTSHDMIPRSKSTNGEHFERTDDPKIYEFPQESRWNFVVILRYQLNYDSNSYLDS